MIDLTKPAAEAVEFAAKRAALELPTIATRCLRRELEACVQEMTESYVEQAKAEILRQVTETLEANREQILSDLLDAAVSNVTVDWAE